MKYHYQIMNIQKGFMEAQTEYHTTTIMQASKFSDNYSVSKTGVRNSFKCLFKIYFQSDQSDFLSEDSCGNNFLQINNGNDVITV